MPKAQETVLEIDLKHLEHNYNYLSSHLAPTTKFLAVVKAFGYGSDAVLIAQHLQTLGVDYLAVAYTSEGVVLRDEGITLPILVLHPLPVNFGDIIERCLEPSLYSPRLLNAFIKVAENKNQHDYPVHIKFNTGLNRLGFWENDVDFIVSKLQDSSAIKVKSIFSHLAASEVIEERNFSQDQISTFNKIYSELSKTLDNEPIKHMCNTSGTLNYPEAHFDMVRCGIGLYGFGNSEDANTHLKPIATLKTVISQIHKIEPNESVGYNRAYKASGYEKIATIPIGHADGISRQYGNKVGFVYINGQKAPIIGNVCMDMLMVDVTHIPCSEGDEVIVFGEAHTAEKLAIEANTISYELITAISQRVKRSFLK